MKYSGKTNFEFYLERFKNKISNEILPLDQVKPEDEYLFDYEEIILQVEGSSYFSPGSFGGAPENSYPAEGDTDIISVIGPDQKSWEEKLTEEERERILTMIEEKVQNQDYDDESDYDDEPFDYGDWVDNSQF